MALLWSAEARWTSVRRRRGQDQTDGENIGSEGETIMEKKGLKMLVCVVAVAAFCTATEAAVTVTSEPGAINRLVVHADRGEDAIAPEIYGHFAEHLGRCVYEGFWVGVDSPIPNVRGIRTDVVEALKKLDIPVLRWPGGCFADEYHWK